MRFPKPIQNVIDSLSILPTVGPKTAERFAFYLLKQDRVVIEKIVQSLIELKGQTKLCRSCLSPAESDPCPLCADPRRDRFTLCVVSDYRDLISLENTKNYLGQYFVLHGELSHLDGITPEKLNIKTLVAKVKKSGIREIIIATNPTIEGETTALYLKKLFQNSQIKITRLARGLPMGSDLEYVDELTLTNALKFRNEL
jgi:recombination protein RecR